MTGSLLFGPILTYSHLSNFWLCECRCRATILVSSQVLQLAWLGAMTCRTCTAFIKLLFQSKDLLGESWFLSNYPNDLILSDFDTCPHWICTNAFDLPCFSKERDLRARVLRILWNAILQCSPKNQTILRYGREGTLWWEQVVCKKARSQHIRFKTRLSPRNCAFLLPFFKETWQLDQEARSIAREATDCHCTKFPRDIAMTSVQHAQHGNCLVELLSLCCCEVPGDEAWYCW